MMNDTQKRVEEIAQKGEVMADEALVKVDNLMAKTATLRHQISRLKDDLTEDLASRKLKKQQG